MSTPALPSIRKRLNQVLLSIALGWGLSMTAGVGLLTHHVLDDLLDGALRESAEVLYALVVRAQQDSSGQPLPLQSAMLPAPPHTENLVWQLTDERGRIRLRSHRAPEQALTDRLEEGYEITREWHIFTLPLGPGQGTLHVAQREEARQATLALAMAATVGLTLLIGGGAAFWINRGLRRELQPLLNLSEQVSSLDPLQALPAADRTGLQAGLTATRTELQPLVAAIDDLTARLALRVAHERATAAHAAHALRTPLAGMDAQLAVALKEAPPSLRPRLTQTREAAARLRRVVTALISLFRSGGELHWQATSVQQLLLRLPLQHTRVQATGADEVPCDPDLLSAALSNLLDNAERHGAREVIVHAEADAEQVRLTVSDDGCGIDPAKRQRLQAALDGQHPEEGLGLGLTLADMVARTHGGRLRLMDSAEGTRIRLSWPPPAA